VARGLIRTAVAGTFRRSPARTIRATIEGVATLPDPDEQPVDAADADRESAYALLQRGQELIQRRHHAQAAIVLERAAREEPGKGSILEPLGRAYHHSAQYDLARTTFESLLELDPSWHWAHFALATSLRKLGRRDEARTHLRLAVALSPSSKLYRTALARLEPSRLPEPK
jgi:Flp pilus assembly protein TadD